MDCLDIVKVEDMTNYKDVNSYLDLGWVLINTYTECYDTTGPGLNHQFLHYVLGWRRGNPFEESVPKYPDERPKYGHMLGSDDDAD